MVRLNEITRLGKIIPDVLIRTLIGSASYPLRNLVTMGGLVCSSWSRLKESYGLDRPLEPSTESPPGDGGPSLEERAPEHPAETGARDTNGASRSPGSAASFIALDARFELRTAETSRWISASRFYSPGGSSLLGGGNSGEQEKPAPPVRRLRKKEAPESGPRRELLTRVRIPLEQWNYSVYRKIQGESSSPEGGGTAVFIAKIEKETLTDIRVIFASSRIIRSQAGETLLTGKLLPLAERDVSHFVELWQTALEEDGRTDGMLRAVLLNCIQACAQELA
jgi:CO/xanthine dehydrogenase FAD-binding subunit